MNNILPNNQCKMINIVWIERGILLTLIYCIIKEYDYLQKKIIIIDNIRYIKLLQFFFSKLKFSVYTKHNSNNYYFNIRNIIRKQDIIIDYINNYNDFINTDKISLIPWFDMNDVLICYKYNKNKKLYINKFVNFIKEFSYYKRCKYNNTIWDLYIENYIFKKYSLFNNFIDINIFIAYFNNFIKSKYTNTVIEKNNHINTFIEVPKIYYVDKGNNKPNGTNNKSNGTTNKSNEPNNKSDIINNIEIQNDEKLNELITLINEKFNLINKIL